MAREIQRRLADLPSVDRLLKTPELQMLVFLRSSQTTGTKCFRTN